MLLSVWWLRHLPASSWRLSRAALGFPQYGSRPATVGVVARPAPVPLLSWLPPSKASQYNAAGLLRQGQASLRSVLRSLDTRPAALGPVAKGESQEKTAEGQPRKRPSDPVARLFTPDTKGGSPGKPRCAFPVTYSGRTSQDRGSIQSHNTLPYKTKAAEEIAAPQRPGPTTTTRVNGGHFNGSSS